MTQTQLDHNEERKLTYDELEQRYKQTRSKSGRRRKALSALLKAHEVLLRRYDLALENNRVLYEINLELRGNQREEG